MIQELGYCSGIENYSRHFDGRKSGQPPYCLLDFFGNDFLLVIDESHVTLPQLRGMYKGDYSRKKNLVDYGFRLPSAFDNRPLKFPEFEKYLKPVVFVSATPADYERKNSSAIVEQLVRPTGLVDPKVEVRPTQNQINDLIDEIRSHVQKNQRTLVTTLTKRMAEDLAEYLAKKEVRVRYMHSEIEGLERTELIRQLRIGEFDVLVGINLLREGLDIPEVSLVAILDADKEGFLRSETSLIQTIGRAARNVSGQVHMYADTITPSMAKAIDAEGRASFVLHAPPVALEQVEQRPFQSRPDAAVQPEAAPAQLDAALEVHEPEPRGELVQDGRVGRRGERERAEHAQRARPLANGLGGPGGAQRPPGQRSDAGPNPASTRACATTCPRRCARCGPASCRRSAAGIR